MSSYNQVAGLNHAGRFLRRDFLWLAANHFRSNH
jgi:hypothetical protein